MMHSKVLLAGLGSGSLAYAAALNNRGSSCHTGMTVSGAINFPIGQISSGQARCGSDIPAGTFTLTNGGMTDSQGRGCWWTPPTMTLQCDVGQVPATGWEIGCDGTVSFNGQTTFYECFGGVVGEYNLYTGPNGWECAEVTFKADSCHSDCPASSAVPPPPPPPAKTSQPAPPPAKSSPPAPPPPKPSSSTQGNCPAALTGNWEFPHLIIPVDSSSPSTAPSSSYFGEVSSTISSIFNFDIPASDSGKTCSLVFLFPEQADLETSSFTFSGSGGVQFWDLASPAVEGQTSFNNSPAKGECLGSVTMAPGNSYVVATFACPAGQRVGYEMTAVGDTCFRYFQDYNPSPIGLYITVC